MWANLPLRQQPAASYCLQLPAALPAPRKERNELNKKNCDFSPNIRHLTPLESVNRSSTPRQNARNFVEFMANKPFVFNVSTRIPASQHSGGFNG
jgi:hypothetical protein